MYVVALPLLALLPLQGLVQSATSAPAPTMVRTTLDPTDRAAKTPKVFIRLKKNRVTTQQHARVKVVVSPQASRSARLSFGRVNVVVEGKGKPRRVHGVMTDHRIVVTLPKLVKGVYRVHATYLGNNRLGKATSPDRKLTVVARGAADAGPTDFPNASNTGVPAGTALTAYTGSSTISRANTVIDGKTLGCIRITAPGVVIRNSRISCANPGTDVVAASDGDFSGTPLLLQDVEIDCKDGPGTAVGEALVTVQRADIRGCENGFDINQGITVQDSYIHDLWNSGSSHTDGIQLASGHFVNGSLVKGALNVTISHNTIYGVGYDGSLGTSAIISNPSGDKNVLIQDNLLAGGAYTLYCDYSGTASNYRVLDNRFSRKFSQKVGAYGPSDGCGDETQSGNIYYESGAALRLG